MSEERGESGGVGGQGTSVATGGKGVQIGANEKVLHGESGVLGVKGGGVGEQGKVSFCDKVVGGRVAPQQQRKDYDLLMENLARIELEDNDPLKPKVFFADLVISQASESWRDALIVKLLGKSLGFSTMKAKLANMWKLKSGISHHERR